MTPTELRKWMHDNYWTPAMLAKRLGVTPTTISRYRSGKQPIPASTIDKLKDLDRST